MVRRSCLSVSLHACICTHHDLLSSGSNLFLDYSVIYAHLLSNIICLILFWSGHVEILHALIST